MIGTAQVVFDPVLPVPVLLAAAIVTLALLALAIWRGLKGWTARALAAGVLLLAMSGPSMQQEQRENLTDIVLVVVDETASQSLPGRGVQSKTALTALTAQINARPDLDMHVVRVRDGADDRGTRLESTIAAAMGDLPGERLAGVIAISDGLLHDAGTLAGAPTLPAPLHLLLTGQAADWDRRLVLKSAPAFAILGEEQAIVLRIEDSGAVPSGLGTEAQVSISIDGATPSQHSAPIGQDLMLPVTLEHGGMNVVQITLADTPGELTTRNNAAIVQVNGVRDRLRVLLVSGQPHPGTRTWRNLLKSDASVDLVHFTILRPPEKQDGVPVSELSLIAFPVQELFLDKIDEFDLIIFDRYELRGILPATYLASVREYVENGGAILISAGPSFAKASSLARSLIGPILPALPSAQIIERAYLPKVTDLGQRHPVTQGLAGAENWGRWLRQIDLVQTSGNVVMTGHDDTPLLVLDRVGEGRVALLASDQAWLWSRGFEGGGPQLELLRRLAHWMMKEPALEEEALQASVLGDEMRITRRSIAEGARNVEVTAPDGSTTTLALLETAPGQFQTSIEGAQIGLYHLRDADLTAVVAVGPAAPREFIDTIATSARLAPAMDALGGGVFLVENGMPALRHVRAGRRAFGRGWLGLTPRAAYLTTDITVTPLLPAWLALLMAALLTLWGWLREGQR